MPFIEDKKDSNTGSIIGAFAASSIGVNGNLLEINGNSSDYDVSYSELGYYSVQKGQDSYTANANDVKLIKFNDGTFEIKDVVSIYTFITNFDTYTVLNRGDGFEVARINSGLNVIVNNFSRLDFLDCSYASVDNHLIEIPLNEGSDEPEGENTEVENVGSSGLPTMEPSELTSIHETTTMQRNAPLNSNYVTVHVSGESPDSLYNEGSFTNLDIFDVGR